MSAPTPRSARLAQSPVALRNGRWWLVGDAGSVPVSDPSFATVLDAFAEAVAAADRVVADLRARPSEPSASGTRGRR
ncbi:hypothetical protein AQF52_7041 [Streptomyces venezuelae]|uniref:hypothetical protein n=1 Tax=Streptomyces gardneri TaxID=66892 RepID=UPI0006BD761E|nr:hypothetical protein [Streptomyces gardneri]ALO12627.1 hypothetical protein AQF52_7041 [Streptomyces venezuelae]QPK49362.1 hypothetical protein H4W23_35330 [Streptomyces gardneri]WRK40890.1 hypothetical protein U0M97_35550 [Streptomyces venezuelae]CUM36735.1 SCE2.08, unknown, len: 76aa [Streptomyces venezuelae]